MNEKAPQNIGTGPLAAFLPKVDILSFKKAKDYILEEPNQIEALRRCGATCEDIQKFLSAMGARKCSIPTISRYLGLVRSKKLFDESIVEDIVRKMKEQTASRDLAPKKLQDTEDWKAGQHQAVRPDRPRAVQADEGGSSDQNQHPSLTPITKRHGCSLDEALCRLPWSESIVEKRVIDDFRSRPISRPFFLSHSSKFTNDAMTFESAMSQLGFSGFEDYADFFYGMEVTENAKRIWSEQLWIIIDAASKAKGGRASNESLSDALRHFGFIGLRELGAAYVDFINNHENSSNVLIQNKNAFLNWILDEHRDHGTI